MKAVELGQEFIYFSFVIQDGKRVVNIYGVCGGFRVSENNFSS